jgi:hypothetical protein
VSALRVALLDHAGSHHADALASALRAEGHEPRLLGSRAIAPVDALLSRRGFTSPLSHVPFAATALARGGYDLAHAFSAPDAAAALAWRRLVGRPVVFTCVDVLTRRTASDRRLRLALLQAALEQADAVIAADERVQSGLIRWFALDAPVLGSADLAAHARLYRELLAAD